MPLYTRFDRWSQALGLEIIEYKEKILTDKKKVLLIGWNPDLTDFIHRHFYMT